MQISLEVFLNVRHLNLRPFIALPLEHTFSHVTPVHAPMIYTSALLSKETWLGINQRHALLNLNAIEALLSQFTGSDPEPCLPLVTDCAY